MFGSAQYLSMSAKGFEKASYDVNNKAHVYFLPKKVLFCIATNRLKIKMMSDSEKWCRGDWDDLEKCKIEKIWRTFLPWFCCKIV